MEYVKSDDLSLKSSVKTKLMQDQHDSFQGHYMDR